ncbi:MAG: S8 family serine peptidase [Saprospiraceae bacterium]
MQKKSIILYLMLTLGGIPISTLVAQNAEQLARLKELGDYFAERHSQRKAEALARARNSRMITSQEVPGLGKMELMYFKDNQPYYYTTFNVNAAKTTSTNHIQVGGSTGYNLTGSTETLGIWDAGTTLTTHQEFGGRVTKSDGATSTHYHATHVGGTMIASGVVASAKGMATQARLNSYDWNNDFSEMAYAAAGGMLVSNHSYGYIRGWYGDTWYGNSLISSTEDYLFGFYDVNAQDLDFVANDAPYYLVVWAAGNDRNDTAPDGELAENDGGADGFDCIGQEGVAKNILTIGAVGDLTNGYTTAGAVSMSSFSNWGPADDGRIKPDLVANGIGLYSTYNSANNAYANLNGTSMATPNVSGSIGLLLQHQRNLYGDVVMRSSTMKALLLHTANDAGNIGPDYSFGWGLPNFRTAAELIEENYNSGLNIREFELSDGQTISFQVFKEATQDLKVTMVWNDPAGTPPPASLNPRTKMLVNDLDLRLNNGSTTFLPWILDVENPGNAATKGDNITDNVEQVLIENANEEPVTVEITHKGSLSGGSQIVSVIISGNKPFATAPINLQDNATHTSGNSLQLTEAYILSNRTVPTGLQVNYIAHDSIVLKPGFTVESGATFNAQIYDPTNNWVSDSRLLYPGFIYERNTSARLEKPSNTSLSFDPIILPEEREEPWFNVSPNPTIHSITLDFEGLSDGQYPTSIQLLDQGGRVLQTYFKDALQENGNTISLIRYPSGIYLLKGYFENGIQTQKIIKN